MRRALLLAAAVLLSGCVGETIRYEPPPAAKSLDASRLRPVSAVAFTDAAKGVENDGVPLTLRTPFFETFRGAVQAQLGALGVKVSAGAADALTVTLTSAQIKRSAGFNADLTGRATYELAVRRDGKDACRTVVSGGSGMKEGMISSPAAQTLGRALTDAVGRLGPALAASCLYDTSPRDPKAVALVISVGRYRGEKPKEPTADAGELARAAADGLGATGERTAVLSDDGAALGDVAKFLERWLPERAKDSSKVFVYFSGLGLEAGGNAYLLPYDADPAYPDQTGYSLARLYAVLAKSSGRVLLVLDAVSPRGGAFAPAIPKAPANVTVLSNAKGDAGFHAQLLASLREKTPFSSVWEGR